MLRITTDEDLQTLTLRLEGRLEGPWVAVLAQCFSGALSTLVIVGFVPSVGVA
jgi:hypothetical protein